MGANRQSPPCSGSIILDARPVHAALGAASRRGRGRGTSSPPQLGQQSRFAAAQSAQKVHS